MVRSDACVHVVMVVLYIVDVHVHPSGMCAHVILCVFW